MNSILYKTTFGKYYLGIPTNCFQINCAKTLKQGPININFTAVPVEPEKEIRNLTGVNTGTVYQPC